MSFLEPVEPSTPEVRQFPRAPQMLRLAHYAPNAVFFVVCNRAHNRALVQTEVVVLSPASIAKHASRGDGAVIGEGRIERLDEAQSAVNRLSVLLVQRTDRWNGDFSSVSDRAD